MSTAMPFRVARINLLHQVRRGHKGAKQKTERVKMIEHIFGCGAAFICAISRLMTRYRGVLEDCVCGRRKSTRKRHCMRCLTLCFAYVYMAAHSGQLGSAYDLLYFMRVETLPIENCEYSLRLDILRALSDYLAGVCL